MSRPAHVPEGWERHRCQNYGVCGHHIWMPPQVIPDGVHVFAVCSELCKSWVDEAQVQAGAGPGLYVDLTGFEVKE